MEFANLHLEAMEQMVVMHYPAAWAQVDLKRTVEVAT